VRHPRYVGTLAILFALWWIGWAIAPHDRNAWLLENALTVIAVAVLGATARPFPLSRMSYTLIFLFLCLHTLGSHYTYSLVPYREWFPWLGEGERNHYDRFVHFAYGLLLAYPIRELFLRIAGVRGFWGYFLPLDLTMSTSMLYELIEWGSAVLFGGDLGVAYLGTQGDPWDAHKDMALASLGALLAMTLTALVNARLKRDFAREWVESLRVKISEPLGEEALEGLLKQSSR
jgi:putative membrane protein